jgi:hypothetical protein
MNSPAATVGAADLASNGFRSTTNVTTTVANGSMSGLTITSVHQSGGKTYSVDSSGVITP